METAYLLAPWLAVIIGLAGVVTAVGHFVRGRFFAASQSLVMGLMVGGIGLFAALLFLNIHAMSRLVEGDIVGEVKVKVIDADKKLFDVTFHQKDAADSEVTSCPLQGDEWQLSGHVHTWRSWTSLMIMPTTYSVEQLGNRYSNAKEGNGKPITICDVSAEKSVLNGFFPGVLVPLASGYFQDEQEYGSGNFMPMEDGAAYVIRIRAGGPAAERR